MSYRPNESATCASLARAIVGDKSGSSRNILLIEVVVNSPAAVVQTVSDLVEVNFWCFASRDVISELLAPESSNTLIDSLIKLFFLLVLPFFNLITPSISGTKSSSFSLLLFAEECVLVRKLDRTNDSWTFWKFKTASKFLLVNLIVFVLSTILFSFLSKLLPGSYSSESSDSDAKLSSPELFSLSSSLSSRLNSSKL